jgi:hypothetical protein
MRVGASSPLGQGTLTILIYVALLGGTILVLPPSSGMKMTWRDVSSPNKRLVFPLDWEKI